MVVVALAALAVLVPGRAAVADHDDSGEHPTFARSPERGPRGTVIKLSGTGCIYYGTAWERARVWLSSVSKEPHAQHSQSSEYFPINNDGSWAGELVIANEAPLGDYVLNAGCYASDMRLEAGRLPFTVTEVPTSTTTTVPAATTTSTTTTSKPRRPTSTTTTSSVSTTTAVPAPTTTALPPEDDLVSAPAGADRGRDGGGPRWRWVAVAALSTAAGGAAATRALRRRRAGTAG